MDETTWAVPAERETAPETLVVASLSEALQKVPDPRRGQGRRSELALILCRLVLAKLAGQKTLRGATEWLRHRGASLAAFFALHRTSLPCQMTYGNVLARVDGKQLDEILCACLVKWEAQSRCGDEPSRLQTLQGQADHAHLASDGKTLRATRSQPHPLHPLSCSEVATGIVFWHRDVQEKQQEISVLKPLLTASLIKGRILALDAMHTQCALCRQIPRLGGDYVLIAKDTQPTLREDIADLFEDRTPDRRRWHQAETWDKGHGRREHRQITCRPALHEWFGKEWEGIEQVFRLERTGRILKTQQRRHEVVYGRSSLSLRQAPPERMLQLIRDHWASENGLHDRRDGSLGEDACQTRTGSVPSLLAPLNSAVLSLMDRAGVRNVARQMRSLDAHLEQALDLVLTGRCSVYENWNALGYLTLLLTFGPECGIFFSSETKNATKCVNTLVTQAGVAQR